MCENGMVGKYVCPWWVCAKLSMISVTHFQVIQKNKKEKQTWKILTIVKSISVCFTISKF